MTTASYSICQLTALLQLLMLETMARFICAGAIAEIRLTADGQCAALPYGDELRFCPLSER
jgi:hypothetical protein